MFTKQFSFKPSGYSNGGLVRSKVQQVLPGPGPTASSTASSYLCSSPSGMQSFSAGPLRFPQPEMLFPTLCLTPTQLQISTVMSLEKLSLTSHSKSYPLLLFFIPPFNLPSRALTSTRKNIIIDVITRSLYMFIPQLHWVHFLYTVFARQWGAGRGWGAWHLEGRFFLVRCIS